MTADIDAHGRDLATCDSGISIEDLVSRVSKIKLVQARVMQRDQHYGVIPGTPKPTLLKPGAEILCLTFQLAPSLALDERREGDHLEVVATCSLSHAPTGRFVGAGIGSCTTRESKYAWRAAQLCCPQCQRAAIIRGREEYGGGWLCFRKKGGCGAKFAAQDPAICGQSTERVPNPDLPDSYNTVRKMAAKRALVSAVLSVTGASELFTQDLEDYAVPELAVPAPDEPTAKKDAFPALLQQLVTLETDIAAVTSYERCLELRGVLGSKGAPSALTREIQSANDRWELSETAHRELGRIWQRLDRALTKRTTQMAPGPEEAYRDDEAPHNGT